MRGNIVILIALLFICSISSSQSYLGWITAQVNFRKGPSTKYSILKSLKPGTQVFIISTDLENNYYNIIDIETNREGYVHKSYVKLGEIVEKNEGGIFIPSGKTENYRPEIEIYNKTDITLTLKLNSKIYSFSPHETKIMSLSPGTYDYRASAPGVIPDFGTEIVKSNMSYKWQFYIITEKW